MSEDKCSSSYVEKCPTGDLFCNCLYFSVNKLARIITKMAEEEFVKTGLNPSYAFALMMVNKNQGLNQNEIAKRLAITPSTLTRFLDKLEQMKLIKRQVEGKSSMIYPTDIGLAKQEEMIKCWSSLHRRYTDIMGIETGDRLAELVYEAAINLEKNGNKAD